MIIGFESIPDGLLRTITTVDVVTAFQIAAEFWGPLQLI